MLKQTFQVHHDLLYNIMSHHRVTQIHHLNWKTQKLKYLIQIFEVIVNILIILPGINCLAHAEHRKHSI